MVTTVRAKFSSGHFTPIEPFPPETLHDGDEVILTVTSAPESSKSALLETAGAWKGLIDPESLKRDIYASRLIITRPPVAL
jgi:hypothetical protein